MFDTLINVADRRRCRTVCTTHKEMAIFASTPCSICIVTITLQLNFSTCMCSPLHARSMFPYVITLRRFSHEINIVIQTMQQHQAWSGNPRPAGTTNAPASHPLPTTHPSSPPPLHQPSVPPPPPPPSPPPAPHRPTPPPSRHPPA